jgi:hypothetical protein
MPLFFIWMMTIVCASNLFAALGYVAPLAWFASQFDFITEDRHTLINIALFVLNLAALPLLLKIGRRLYAPPHSENAETSVHQVPADRT